MVFKVAFAALYKMATFKKGSLAIISFALSGGTTFYLKKLMEGTDLKHIIVPIVIFAVGTLMYVIFLLADLHTGLQVARHESLMKFRDPKKPYVKSYKLYRTLWKLLGVLLMSFLLGVTSLMVEIIDLSFLYKIFIAFQGSVWLLACGFEVHSIGENHLKRYGYKPRLFKFFDNILNLFEKRIVDKIDKSFEILESEPNEKIEETEVVDEEIVNPKSE
ncbi:hypothetical protein LIT13_06785 [Flavobacterium psychrophilum]|jgi:hypothetical protein|uniref:hypothetical protein n=1 Tax=Flavobacterium phage Fpv7 TaxID=1814287 RepID=UPI00078B40DE|nr:hypothetical protein [Flavobacterium psychrophilum]YP_009321221.1 hypothetical protein BOW77_gp16 [Flavobacterium phage Fpv7]YP_009322287.1 hypothetical protein BOW76_gp16 [Flavobacterium phage Fpv8]YP_009322393.1 hypothetical protein BOW79_gp16 [Flavobacterium phage Fpv5]YP_009323687.1 hypothetical protein BOW72_gp16 [Flavobacterium phage Fpv10]YP_009324539.1 hypothetical protein BOW78_gp16 [Flavobacterium phage Fpv6]YP_009325227.1 hypothetical protein BOW83_gp16 [Flavobacterium phage Fpv